MGRTERFYKIERMLAGGQVVTTEQFLTALEVSRATFRRDLDYLRDRLGAPIEWDASAGGYRLQAEAGNEGRHALPGLWLNDQEIYALLTGIQLLSSLELQELIGSQIKPMRERLEKLLDQEAYSTEEIQRRIHLMPLGHRQTATTLFQGIAHALFTRKRLFIRHFGRQGAAHTEREVSPQRLTYYRDNWYLDAFCHLRDDLRSFALDAIEVADVLDKAAVSVDDVVLHAELDKGYGIFSGGKLRVAKLKFSPFRARWVAKEIWHPEQKGRLLEDGSYQLEVPYVDDRELIQDILRQGREVEVIEPFELRQKLIQVLKEMIGNHTYSSERIEQK